MQVEKKSFVLYNDQSELLNMLNDEQAGVLIKKIFSYVNDGVIEKEEDIPVNMVFTTLKNQIDRDTDKYYDKIDKSSKAGKVGNLKRWHPEIYRNYEKGQISLEEAIKQSKEISEPDQMRLHPIANIADNVIVNEIEIDTDKLLKIYNSTLGKKTRVISESVLLRIKQLLKEGYNKEDLITAIKNAADDQFHKDSNYKNLTLEFITRPDKFERFVNMGDYNVKSKIL